MFLKKLLIGGALLVAAGQIWAQSSGKPIRIVVPYAAGGGTDVVARVLQGEMAKRLGTQVIVENRTGAGGVVGAKSVVAADADGTTYLFGYAANLTSVFNKTNFVDATKELSPVSNVASSPLLLFSSGVLPVRSFQELVAYSKANPAGKLNFAVMSPNVELVMNMIKNATGITFTPVQYKGAAPAATAVLSGEADLLINVWVGLDEYVQSGKARALLYGAPKRSELFPDVPVARELGLQGIESSAANLGFWAPRGTPTDQIQRVSRAAIATAQAPEIAQQLRKVGYLVIGSTPEDQLRAHDAEVKFYAEAARISNYVPQ
jgi:tripartite-type tricarboxylate transporter receptor subunit TctC